MKCETCGEEADDIREDGICGDCTDAEYFAEFRQLRAEYAAQKAAGLLKPREEYEADLRDAGRGHLIGDMR